MSFAGTIGALLDFTHLTHLAEPSFETSKSCGERLPYSHLWGNLPPTKGTSKTLASLKSCLIFPFRFIYWKDLEGPMFVRHGHRQSSNQNESDAPFGKGI